MDGKSPKSKSISISKSKSVRSGTDDGCCGCYRRKEKRSKTRRVSGTTNAPGGKRSPEAAAADLLLVRSSKERKQVQKALEEEMARRRAHRATRSVDKFAAGPPEKAGVGGAFPVDDRAKEDEFSADMVPDEQAYCASPEGVEKSVCLDDQRREWIKKMQSHAGATTPKPGHEGYQPDSLTVDRETAKELGSHTLTNMLQRVLIQAWMVKAFEKARKAPTQMSPEELIRFRRQDPEAYDAFVTANSVTSFGLAKPTADDQTRAKKIQAKYTRKHRPSDSSSSVFSGRKRKRVHFDNEVDVVAVPIGEDFHLGEEMRFNVASLKTKRDL